MGGSRFPPPRFKWGGRLVCNRWVSEDVMAKIGRNDRCPCGSGQKYKRCCLPRDEAADRAAALACEAEDRSTPDAVLSAEDDGLADPSNGVLELIEAGRLDEAEHAAQDLLERYPEVHDELERLAMVAAARGDRARAADYYNMAADFVH